MKAFKVIVVIAFVFISLASAAVYISEKINTDKTIPQITVEEEMIEVSLKATDDLRIAMVYSRLVKRKDMSVSESRKCYFHSMHLGIT